VHEVGQTLRNLDLGFERPGEHVPPGGVGYSVACGRQPDATAGQALLEIGDDLALWREDEADQLLFRPPRTRERAGANGFVRLPTLMAHDFRQILLQPHSLLSW